MCNFYILSVFEPNVSSTLPEKTVNLTCSKFFFFSFQEVLFDLTKHFHTWNNYF
jgi:hypothetical protein